VPTFLFEGQKLVYTSHGEGKRWFVLLHGQLLNQRMHWPLAQDLALRGHRVVTLDLLGHGESSRPREMWRYSMAQFARQVVALLDHLEADQAVIGGTSLGANVTLEFADLAPERARGLVIEMPVLDNGVFAAVLAFTPLLTLFKMGMPVVRVVSGLVDRLPHRGPLLYQITTDVLRQDHSSSAAVLQGLFLGRIAPGRVVRKTFGMSTLVIGHSGDPIHPYTDADMLAAELRNARLVQANNILELRLHPERLTGEIAAFLDDCWQPRQSTRESA
jgi:pimeloyl-ACP methyl ester carboxylesterase